MCTSRPWDRATRAMDAQGSSHAISTCCLSAAGCCRVCFRIAHSIVSMTELSWTRDWLRYFPCSRWDAQPLTPYVGRPEQRDLLERTGARKQTAMSRAAVIACHAVVTESPAWHVSALKAGYVASCSCTAGRYQPGTSAAYALAGNRQARSQSPVRQAQHPPAALPATGPQRVPPSKRREQVKESQAFRRAPA